MNRERFVELPADGARDVHTMPTDREHECTAACWCEPELYYVADDGTKVWLHKEMQ